MSKKLLSDHDATIFIIFLMFIIYMLISHHVSLQPNMNIINCIITKKAQNKFP